MFTSSENYKPHYRISTNCSEWKGICTPHVPIGFRDNLEHARRLNYFNFNILSLLRYFLIGHLHKNFKYIIF